MPRPLHFSPRGKWKETSNQSGLSRAIRSREDEGRLWAIYSLHPREGDSELGLEGLVDPAVGPNRPIYEHATLKKRFGRVNARVEAVCATRNGYPRGSSEQTRKTISRTDISRVSAKKL